jgi:hypothetical protein
MWTRCASKEGNSRARVRRVGRSKLPVVAQHVHRHSKVHVMPCMSYTMYLQRHSATR